MRAGLPAPRSCYPPCRRLRSVTDNKPDIFRCYPPCRRLRSYKDECQFQIGCYPPCRRLRRCKKDEVTYWKCYPPCRRLRSDHIFDDAIVIRRVGGLEDPEKLHSAVLRVIRRVGGLEVISFWSKVSSSDMLPPNVHAESKYPR